MDIPAFLHPFARPAATTFTSIVRGEGAEVWDADGNRYIDALASLWYCNIGHGREEMADAIAAQARTLAAWHTFERFTNPPVDELCARVAEIAPFERARVFLTSSGSEAVDTAVKLARVSHAIAGQPERTVVLSRRPSYHGVSYGGLSLTGLPANQAHFGPLVGDVEQVAHDDLTAMKDAVARHAGAVAAIVAEPVIGAGGVHPPADGYLEGLRELCDDEGAWLVFDEVICGLGRLGTWWAADYYGVRPDLVTFAKAITSGYQPLGGVLVGRAVADRLEADAEFVLRHGHTYSGHPTACAAGLEALAITEREGLLERAATVGARLAAGLQELADDGLVAELRGAGAVWGLGMREGVDAVAVRDALLDRGVIARPIGSETLAFCPPLVIRDDQIDDTVQATEEALVAVGATR